MLKKGINYLSFMPGTDVKTAVKLAKDAQFEGIELMLCEEGIAGMKGDNQAKEAKNIIEDAGLEVSGFSSTLHWSYPLTSSNPNIIKKSKDSIKCQLEIASELGADTALVVPGMVAADFMPGCEICDYDVAYKRAFEAIYELKEYAEEVKVNIGIENVGNKLLVSPLETRDFIDKIDSKYVGVYFDVGNVLYQSGGYPEQWIKILGKRIKMVHFKDYRRIPGGLNAFVDLLAGDVNYPAVVEALEGVGFDGYCNAEMLPPYKYYSDQIIYNTSASMDRILKRK